MKQQHKNLCTLVVVILFVVSLYLIQNHLDSYKVLILTMCGINVILGLSMNLINGFTGQFSLGHAGFMAVGAYTMALLMMPPAVKDMNWFAVPIWPPLRNICLPFFPAILCGGLVAAVFGVIIGIPALRLRGDYLAIATLGFAEVIRVVIVNIKPITNGALGLKSIPVVTNLYWAWGIALAVIFLMIRLVNSSYGLALKAINEDDVAAEAMGVGLFYHKMLAFTLSAFLAGLGGALQGNLLGTVDPSMYTFMLTFNILMIVVLGGMGSITGTIVGAMVVTIAMEWLRFVESPMSIGSLYIPGISGMRMVIFSFLLLVVILFYQQGLLGKRELTWDGICAFVKGIRDRFGGKGKGSARSAGEMA